MYGLLYDIPALGEEVVRERRCWWLCTRQTRVAWAALGLTVGTAEVRVGSASAPDALRGYLAVLVGGWRCEEAIFDSLLPFGRVVKFVALLKVLVLAR